MMSILDKLAAQQPAPPAAPAQAAPTTDAPETEPSLSSKLRLGSPDYSAVSKGFEQAAEAAKPKSAAETLAGFEQLSAQATADAKKRAEADPQYQAQAKILGDVQQQIKDTKELMANKQVSGDWLRAIDTISQSLVQFAAAKYGKDKGLNLSGVKTQPTDWDSIINKSLGHMQDQLQGLRGEGKEARAQMEDVSTREQKAGERGVAEAQQSIEKAKQLDLDMARNAAQVQMHQLDNSFHVNQFNIQQTIHEMNQLENKDAATQAAMFKDIKNKQIQTVRSDLKNARQQEKMLNEVRGEIEKVAEAQASGDLKDVDIAKMNARLSERLQAAGIDRKKAQETTTKWLGLMNEQKENPQLLKDLVESKLSSIRDNLNNKEEIEQGLIMSETPGELRGVLKARPVSKTSLDVPSPTTAAPVNTSPAGTVIESGGVKMQKLNSGNDKDKNNWKQVN